MRTTGDWLAARYPWTRGVVVFSGLVGLVGCLVAVVFRTEIVASDPVSYIGAAAQFPDDSWVPLGYTRYGMILPRVPLVWLFDNSQLTAYFWPVVSTGVLVGCTYLVGQRYWGWQIALLAVVLSLSSTITFVNLSRGYPDLQSTALFTAAVVISLGIRDRLVSGGGARWWSWLAVGLLLGWAFETRETTILTWPIVAVVLWVRNVPVRGLALLAAGIAAWAVTDILIGWIAYDDPWIRVYAFTKQDLAVTSNPADQEARTEFVGRSRWFYFTAVPVILATEVPGGWSTLLLLGLALIALRFAGGARFVAVWFVVSYLTFAGITGGFFPDSPSGRIDIQRYWISFLPVLGLAAAGAVGELTPPLRALLSASAEPRLSSAARHSAPILAFLVALGPVVSVAWEVAHNPQYVVSGGDQLSQLRTELVERPELLAGGVMFADPATRRVLPVYQRPPLGGDPVWQLPIFDLKVDGVQPGRRHLVVINSLDNDSCRFCREWLTAWYEAHGPIPDDWVEVWASSPRNLVLYRVE